VSNRFIDPVTKAPVTVIPFARTKTGAVRPITRLQTMNGRTYGTLNELRRDSGRIRPYAVTPGVPLSGAIRDKRKSSYDIRGNTQGNYPGTWRDRRGSYGVTTRDDQRRFIAPRAPSVPYSPPRMGVGAARPYVAPGAP
jgi:hypothetical protein